MLLLLAALLAGQPVRPNSVAVNSQSSNTLRLLTDAVNVRSALAMALLTVRWFVFVVERVLWASNLVRERTCWLRCSVASLVVVVVPVVAVAVKFVGKCLFKFFAKENFEENF